MAKGVIARGAVLHERTAALEIEPGVVHTTGGRIECDRVIVAVDGALGRVLPELAAHARPARLQMLATAPGTAAHPAARSAFPIYARWGLDYWQRLPDGRLLLGGFRDAGHDDEWTSVAEPSDRVQCALDHFLRDSLGVAAPVTHRWAAIVSYTETRLPIVREVRHGVWAVGGYCGTGNVIGALCGRDVARLAYGEPTEFVHLLGAE